MKSLIKESFDKHLLYSLGKDTDEISPSDAYIALALSLRDVMMKRYVEKKTKKRNQKHVYYLSMEFLMGQLLNTTLVNMHLRDAAAEIVAEKGFRLDDLIELEPDAALGNGGLGRLAACFLDSMATLGYACSGYGLCYEYGLFKQIIQNGAQQEFPDVWLTGNYPWLIDRHDRHYDIRFYGHVDHSSGKAQWRDAEIIRARASDMLLSGEGEKAVTLLRLWRAVHGSEFKLDYFQHGDYIRAMADQIHSETISKVLYPIDQNYSGLELRLKQEYFLASATIQDALEIFKKGESNLDLLPERVFFQLNETHCAIVIAELQRILVDIEGLEWSRAWEITCKTIGYTNHTILPEGLESWNLDLFGKLLPRHLEIIYDINFNFLRTLRARAMSPEEIAHASIIAEGHPKRIRMASLAVVGSAHVNGVSALHTKLLKTRLFPEFARIWPEKFSNKTNGIALRRWLISANPRLTALIHDTIGENWHEDHLLLRDLLPFRNNKTFCDKWYDIRQRNKQDLFQIILERTQINLPADSFLDVQVKRIHEYKRQLLNIIRIAHICMEILAGTYKIGRHRTFLFAGKAAPGYHRAKLTIRLVCALSAYIEKNPLIRKHIQVVFLPNFSVSLAERIYPAADLSEQISMAGTEASGTGNMKFMLNGVPTFGTFDGANIEIRNEVGPENIYIFGHTVEELQKMHHEGYNPVQISQSPEIRETLDFIQMLHIDFREFCEALTYQGDNYFNLADFSSYCSQGTKIIGDYEDRYAWTAKGIVNTAYAGKFSADRTVAEYAKDIWKII